MYGYLIPPTVEIGQQITDSNDLDKLELAINKRKEITTLAKAIGPKYGMSNADHFHVPYKKPNGLAPARDNQSRLIAYIARTL